MSCSPPQQHQIEQIFPCLSLLDLASQKISKPRFQCTVSGMLISSGEPIPLFSFVHGWFCVCEDELGLGLGFREKF